MQKAKNKHGPDIDIGLRMGWPRGPAIITGEPPPWIKIRYGPPDIVATCGDSEAKRKRGRPRDFVMLRRIGESPPKIVKGKNINYIDFKIHSNYWLLAIAMPCFSGEKDFEPTSLERKTKRQGELGKWRKGKRTTA